MKIKKLIILILTVLFSLSSLATVSAQQGAISLDAVTAGLHNTDTLNIDVIVSFMFRMENNTGDLIVGFSNGFRIYSPQGATWTTSGGTITGAISPVTMMENFFVNPFSITGADADTVGFGGFSLFAPGIPDGFNDTTWTIDLGPLSACDHGKQLCIDTAFFPPANPWLWALETGGSEPTWSGPHCFVIFDPNAAANSAPVLAAIGAQSTDENVNLTFIATATDADGTTPVMTSSALPTGAIYTDNLDGTGTFSWTPDFTQSGSYDVTFYATDDCAAADSETVIITVNNANQPPVLATIGAQSTDENLNLNFVATATDADGTTPVMTSSTLPAGATYIDNLNGTGTFDWTPDFTQSGSYNVTFYATDDSAAVDSEIVTITVNDVAQNNPPVLSLIGAQSVDENVNLNFVATASDVESVPVMTSSALPTGATYTENLNGTGTFDWTPDFTQSGSYNVTFYATDDSAAVDSEIVTITVNDVNQAPVLATIGAQTIDENVNLNFVATATDVDGTTPVMTSSALPTGATYTDNSDGTGTFNWTPDFTQSGSYDVTFYATDDSAAADSETVTITVNNANQPPVLTTIGAQSTDENLNLNFVATATDADGTTPVMTSSALPTGATYNDNSDGTGTLNWTPDFTQAGSYDVTFYATDDSAAVDSETVTITVNDVNQLPVLATIADVSVDEGSNLNFAVTATDADGNNTLTMSISTTNLPGGHTYADNGSGSATFDWTPSSTNSGVYTAMFVASDGTDADSQLVTITVNNFSPPPSVSATGTTTLLECETFVLAVTGSAGDAGTIALTAVDTPAGSNFTDNGGGNGAFSWTAVKGSTTDSVMLIATESPSGLADTIVVVLTVTPNIAPVFAAQADAAIAECDAISFAIAATDGNGESLTFTDKGTNKGSFVDNGDNTITYSWAPTNGDAGVYTETFYATDGCGDTDTLSFILTVNANAAPVLSAITDAAIVECASVARSITATDADGDPLTITVGDLPTGATFTDNGNGTASFSWSTSAGDASANAITIAVADDCGGVDTVVFNVTVTANAAPAISPVADTTVNECGVVGFSLTATDAESGSLTYSSSGADVNSVFTDNSDGTANFSWNTASGDAGIDSVWFVVTDDCGLVDSELVVITVIIDSIPQFATQADTNLTQNDTMVIIVSATDPESVTLTLTIDSASVPDAATEWTFVSTGTDSATFTWFTTGNTPSGAHTINFFASDGCGTVTLSVNFDITTSVVLVEGSGLPEDFYLSQNYPNPFNPNTEIVFGIPERSHVKVAVYNVLGQQIRLLVDEYMSAGTYITGWDGKSDFGLSVSSGIYFYKLETLQYFETKKMILLK